MRLNVGIDVDGILANFIKPATTIAHDMFDTPIIENSYGVKDWNMGLEDWQIGLLLEEIFNIRDFWLSYIESIIDENTFKRLNRLANRHHIYFVTDRTTNFNSISRTAQMQTVMWLRDNCIYNPSVIVQRNKSWVVKALGLNIYIDDNPKNIEMVDKNCPSVIKVTMDYPYCKKQGEIQNLNCIKDFNEFLDVIESF